MWAGQWEANNRRAKMVGMSLNASQLGNMERTELVLRSLKVSQSAGGSAQEASQMAAEHRSLHGLHQGTDEMKQLLHMWRKLIIGYVFCAGCLWYSTEVMSFVLAAYGNIGEVKYLYFSIMLLWYISICVANTFLIVVIYMDRRLHEPMYILLCNLFVNEIGASTSMYPFLLSQMFSDTHEVTLPWCFLHMGCVYISSSIEFCSLAAMAYDRYVSICYPLRYNVIMNTGRVGMIILLVWMYSFGNFIFSFSVIIRLTFCGNVIDKVFCDYHLIIKLACSVSILNNISDLLFVCVTIVIPFSLISVSYIKILTVCLNTSKENTQKAITTCTPQIVSVSNLFIGCMFHYVDSRLDVALVPDKGRIILSVYLIICQPMITPFMYGFYLLKIRQSCKRFLFNRK
ncbi:olfactory receptor 7G1-like [Epinephelus moara]|uniref:olfactory receptor 7G1-like n=1 Tax=Epinephelus moara TaxID=300413 RepID=UPI00214F3843|nr:olfactory receptor 7G1-like [Epinephelus moara]